MSKYDDLKNYVLEFPLRVRDGKQEREARAITSFASQMFTELRENDNKGSFLDWMPDLMTLDAEFQYHYRKLQKAALNRDKAKVAEYAADLGNYCLKFSQIFGGRGRF